MAIFGLMTKKGMKALTMDYVSSKLSISKRTLYEMFSSKQEMINRVVEYHTAHHIALYNKIMEGEENVLEALLKIYAEHKKFIMSVSVEFFRDMDEYAASARRKRDEYQTRHIEGFAAMLRRGIDEGVFRPDINFAFTTHIIRVQMEALKRMEEFFPKEISIAEVYDNIILGFLRSLVSRKGFDVLERVLEERRDKLFTNDNKN